MVPEDMYQALIVESKKIGTFGHGFTYGGHPVAAAVALKTLEIYARDRVFEQAAAKAPRFQARLRKLGEHPFQFNRIFFPQFLDIHSIYGLATNRVRTGIL